jgi:hypothetical protein
VRAQRVAAPAAPDSHAARFRVEVAAGEEVRERELVDPGASPVGEELRAGDGVDQAREEPDSESSAPRSPASLRPRHWR